MIVRYVVPRSKLYWMWANEALGAIKPGKKSVTIKLEDRHCWTEDTAAEVERSVVAWRKLRSVDRRTSFRLSVVSTGGPLEAAACSIAFATPSRSWTATGRPFR